MSKSIDYQSYLIQTLTDPDEAAGYLNAALEGGDLDVFLLALKNVVTAHGGMKILAEKTKRSRTSLYKSLSKTGNPHLKGTNDILHAMGMHLAVVAGNEEQHLAG
ncbi:MAG: putative addiction module antidote protein [Gammaproteobacteria bacterium]|nr:putative addiction module antidote protein [Gammaproteobacteria bacterium]